MKKILLSAVLILTAELIFAQFSVNINPDKDNSIFSESNNSSGAGKLYAGRTCQNNNRRALMHFDIAGNVPAGSTITGVSLTLNVDNQGSGAGAQTYTLHEINTDWGEGTSSASGQGATAVAPDATWSDAMLGTVAWTTAGGDFNASPSASTTLNGVIGNYTWTSATMVTEVQSWLDTPVGNLGWMLIGDETAVCSARRFGSKDQGTAPILTINYTCAMAPNPVCQSIIAYLDNSGVSVINPNDFDNGSVATCGGNLSFSSSTTTFTCAEIDSYAPTDSLVISAVFDGPLSGGTPKGVELYAVGDIADLSVYGLGSANNGGGTDGVEFTFPAVAVTAGTYIYVASEAPQFTSWFGFAPDYTDAALNVNGDDAIELFNGSVVIDVFGDQNVDGTNEPWEYLDGWAYRNSSTGPTSSFILNDWTFSSPDALDGELTNATAVTPIPVGTYVDGFSSSTAVTVTITDDGGNSAVCDAYVTVMDTLPPAVQCIGSGTFLLDGTGNLTLTTGDIDNGTTDNCGLQGLSLSQTAFDCSNLGANAVTLYATDIYGNIDSCVANITIQDAGGMSITEDNVGHLDCYGDTDGTISVSVSGGTPAYTYDWDNDGTGDNDDLEDLTGLAGGVYTLTVTDNSGCIASIVVTVNEPDSLEAGATFTNSTCFGTNDGTASSTVIGGTGPFTYDWDNDGTGDFDDNATISALTPGTYTVVVLDANGCSVTESVTVLDGTPVDVSVSLSGDVLTANASGAGYSYLWLNCPGFDPVGSNTDQSFIAPFNYQYAVQVTDPNGCVDTSACTQVTEVGFDEFNPIDINIYPNPTGGEFLLDVDAQGAHYSVTIAGINGQIIYAKNKQMGVSSIDLSENEAGIYFVTVISDAYSRTQRIQLIK